MEEYLIEKGASLNIQDVYGNTALHLLVQRKELVFEDMKSVLEAKPDFSILNVNGQSPLHIFIQHCDDEEKIKSMVQSGANLYCVSASTIWEIYKLAKS